MKRRDEGWGLASDAKGGLVLSDGSDTLFFLDPRTYSVIRTVKVTDAGRPVRELNELEWIEGEIWSNVWQTDRIARINPKTGAVNAWVDFTLLWPRARRTPPADVLNGIAYDPATKRIFSSPWSAAARGFETLPACRTLARLPALRPA